MAKVTRAGKRGSLSSPINALRKPGQMVLRYTGPIETRMVNIVPRLDAAM
jgi:hypothetical protein